jgi:hypothetical protein
VQNKERQKLQHAATQAEQKRGSHILLAKQMYGSNPRL